jgi:transposase InsO family protein
MPAQHPRQQVYDHRLRQLVRHSGDIRIATDLGVPRSTADGWLRGEAATVVTLDLLEMNELDLQVEVVKLRRRIYRSNAVVALLLSVLRVSGFRLDEIHIWDRARRADLLRAAERARKVLPTGAVLRILRVSASRYSTWTRTDHGCAVDGRSECPRSAPNQLTPAEVFMIKEMATAEGYRHVPTGRLAILAQRLGRVFASPSTWYQLIRDREWRRPRARVHPASPKVGVRAKKPDEIWHIDASCVRLVDGTKVWLHAVIDNFSRRVLAWCITERFEIMSTVSVLRSAVEDAVSCDGPPQLFADGGIENFNAGVDGLVGEGMLRRVQALVDVRFSNSMIESWWNNLKHQWLFQHRLDSVAAVRRLVEFYVSEYNSRIPHAAFRGQTPDEVYYGGGTEVPAALEEGRGAARSRRLAINRAASCEVCPARGLAA